MDTLKKIGFLQELIILFLFILLINNYFGNKRPVILADGKGYYEYLPSIFIYNDLSFNYTDTLVSEFYDHKITSKGYLPLIEDNKVNKYFVGTAVAQAPFFFLAHLIAINNPDLIADGYSLIYQDFVFYAALFYLFIGLIFIRKLLQYQKVPIAYIFAIQIAILFASSLMYYVVSLPSFSHVYSFAFINIFLFLIAKYSMTNKNSLLYFASAILGIILLIRPVNGLVVLFIPFIFNDAKSFWSAFLLLFTHKKKTIIFSALIITLLISIQSFIWYLQTGSLFIKSYQDERLILSQPQMIKFLFSYQKGFFVYAPVFLFLIMVGTINYVRNKNTWKLVSFYLAFIITIYVLSSWWVWYYGASLGSRVMIDYYGVIALFGSTFFIHRKIIFKSLAILLIGIFAYLAIIQTYQYDNYILHWTSMNKERYWRIFLKTEDKYKGVLWYTTYYPKKEDLFYSNSIKNQPYLNQNPPKTILIDSIKIDSNQTISKQVAVKLIYEIRCSECTDKVLVTIDDTYRKNKYYFSRHLFYGTQKENFSGTATINLKLEGYNPSSDYLNIYLIKQEKTSEIDSFNIELFNLD